MPVDAGSVYSSVRIRLDQLDNDLKGVFARLNQLESTVTKTTTTSQNSFQRFFSFIKSSGLAPVASLTAGFALLRATVTRVEEAWEGQTEALSKVSAVLRSTGADAWTSTEAIAGIAESLQKVTLYADDEIESMQAVLLGFRSIRGDNFNEATKAILNMATVMKQDLGSTAQQVGKALDLLDWNALSRQGFKFTEQQKAAGEAMKAAGDIAGAQKIILDELNLAFGGAAEEVAKNSSGQKQLKNAIGEVDEEIGRALASGFKPLRGAFVGIAEAVAAAIKKANDYREAVEASKAGAATEAQAAKLKIKALNDELKVRQANINAMKSMGDENLESTAAKEESAAIARLQYQIRLTQQLLDSRTAYADAQKKAAATQATIDQVAEAQALIDLEIQQKRIALYDKYTAAVSIADDLALRGYITQEEREQRIKSAIEAEIEGLEALKTEYQITDSAATTKRIDEQIAALTELKEQINGASEAEDRLAISRAASAARADEERDANSELYYTNKENNAQLEQRGLKEVELLDLARRDKIAKIEASNADQKYKERAIQSTNALYKALKDDAAWNQFAQNADKAFGAFNAVFSALTDLVTTLANNQRDAQLSALEDVQEAEKEMLDARYDALVDALNAEQEAENESHKARYDALETALDAELQARLYAAGLAKAETLAQLQEELDAAIATGDAEAIAKAEDALEKATIEEEFAARQKALQEQRAAEEKALREQQAADEKALQESRAAEEKALEEKQAKERADINYKAEIAAWRMKKIAAAANAAAAIVGALSAPPYWPWNSAFVTAAGVAGALQVAAVSAAKPVLQYATGGIVPGTRTRSDSVPAMLKPHEAVLTETQQAEFMRLANGGGSGSAIPQTIEIPIYLDAREITRAVVSLVNDGKYFIKQRAVIK